MKKVLINSGKVGLVSKDNEYKRVLKAGKHSLKWGEDIVIYSMDKPFEPEYNLNLLLDDLELTDMLHIVEISDNEIALKFEDGIFKGILKTGRYTYWKGLIDYRFEKLNVNEIEIPKELDRELLHIKVMANYIRIIEVAPFEKAVLFIDGNYVKSLEPGSYYFWRNNIKVHVVKSDMRKQQLEISGQEILTKDKAAIRVNFYAQYSVVDIEKALIETKEYDRQLYILIQLALREYTGTLTLDELLEKKEEVSVSVMNSLKDKTEKIGVDISESGIRDIILPGDVKEIMNQVLIAQKKAQANIITRREETASTRSLMNTAKLMEDNSMLFKLKEMEYVEKIADKINTISLSGGGQMVDQLRNLFTPGS